ncbi:MAG: sulfotransferase [Bacteriovoracaceae bacterium]|nr:sulfotransferase [Bacteriovoracaceae bacterium]
MINLFVGPSVRSGGSLINRLFDHHPNVAAYPFELFLPMDHALHPSLKNRGQKLNVQNFPSILPTDTIDLVIKKILLDRESEHCLVGKHFKNEKLIAKTSGLNINAAFVHQQFLYDFTERVGNDRSISHIYNSLHHVFFKNWDKGKHSGTLDYVVYHSGNGLLADIELYFKEFPDSYFIQPVRDVRGYLASEKKKVFRQLIGRGRIGRRINWPDWILKYYYGKFFETTLVNWLITVTRSVILKQKIGERYIIYRHEDLVRNPQLVMKKITNAIGMDYHEGLLTPTVAGVDWRGNSMFGLQSGINPKLADVRDVFNRVEECLIEKYSHYILDYLSGFENELVDFSSLDTSKLFDYELQQKYYADREKTALYFASMYERWAYTSICENIKATFKKNPNVYFLT